MFIFGHRGSSGTEPENTLRSFRAAVAAGADGIELDVQATADGVPVIIHDRTVSRTTDGSGEVSSMPLTKLRQLDAGLGEQVPTLDEVLALLAGQLTIDLEIKQAGIEPIVLDTLAQHPTADWFISSFDWDTLAAVRRLSPTAKLWPITIEVDDAVLAIAAELAAPGIAVLHKSYTAETATQCSQAGLAVGIWTVNDPAEGRRFRELGASILMSDYPTMMRAAING